MTSAEWKHRAWAGWVIAVALLVGGGASGAPVRAAAPPPPRVIALTFDDLPAMEADVMTTAQITAMNRKLLAALTAAKAPAIGFVNEKRLYMPNEVDPRIAVLKAWLDDGFDLGNHTFSHTSLNHVPLQEWEDDVIAGETVTRMLLRRHNMELRYLRQPYLDAGPDLQTKRAAEAFLSERGYRVAPVTIDAWDWYFADVYDDARTHNDDATQQKALQEWLAYTDAVLSYEEAESQKLLGYEPKQVMLLHDTWLEADHFGELVEVLRRHGYRFISLQDALKDPAYAQTDDYVSDTGASWIQRWAVTRGRLETPGTKPELPAWVQGKHREIESAKTE